MKASLPFITFLVIISGYLSLSASESIYRCTDAKGQVFYTDDLSQIPMDQRPHAASFRPVVMPNPPDTPVPGTHIDMPLD